MLSRRSLDSAALRHARFARAGLRLERKIRCLGISFRRSPEGSSPYGTQTLPSYTGDRTAGQSSQLAAPVVVGPEACVSRQSYDAPAVAEQAALSSTHSARLRTSEAISPYPGCFALEPGRSADSGAIGNDPMFLTYWTDLPSGRPLTVG